MSGNTDKNPQVKQSVDKKVSSTGISENSISGTSIIKPTRENYYEVNGNNEELIRKKYVELEKKYREFQSEIQTFNMHYKQLLELNKIHEKPYFLPSIGLMKNSEEIQTLPANTHGDPHASSVAKSHTFSSGSGESTETHKKTELQPQPEPEPMSEKGGGGENEIKPKTGGASASSVATISGNTAENMKIAPLENEKIPQYFSCLRCDSPKCKGENRLMAIFQFDKDNKLTEGGDLTITRTFILAQNNQNNTSFKCMCRNHKFTGRSGCVNSELIKREGDNPQIYKFNAIGDNPVNMIFFCYDCKQYFRYECLRTINEDNSISDMSSCIKGVTDLNANELNEIFNTLPSINKNLIFRKPLFEKEYSDNLVKIASSLEVGLKISKGGIKLHAGLGPVYNEMGNAGIGLSVAGAAGAAFMLGASPGIGVAAGSAVAGIGLAGAITAAKSKFSKNQSGGAGEPQSQNAENFLGEAIRSLNVQVDETNESLNQSISAINELTERVEERTAQNDAINVSSNYFDTSNQNKLLSRAGIPDENYSLKYGKKYKDLKMTETYEDFILELKKWKISEGEEALIQAYDSIKGEIKSVSESEYKKYRPQYKQLQDSYIYDFNAAVDGFKDYPFRKSDFNDLLNLRNVYDTDSNAYTETPLKLGNSDVKIKDLNDSEFTSIENTPQTIKSLLISLEKSKTLDINSEGMITYFLNLLGVDLRQRQIDSDQGEILRNLNIGNISRGYQAGYQAGYLLFTPSPKSVKEYIMRDDILQGIINIQAGIKQKYEELEKITLNFIKFKKLKDDLKGKYDPLKREIDNKINVPQGDEKPSISSSQYKDLLARMCGRKAATFWYGENDTLNKADYIDVRSLFSGLGLLYLPFYDLNLLKAIMAERGPPADLILLSEDNLKGNTTNAQAKVMISEILNKLENLSRDKPYSTEYNQEVLPLFDLLKPNQSRIQLLNNGEKINGAYNVTQLTSTNDILSGSNSLDFEGSSIWVKPLDSMGLEIVSPIQLLKIKQGLLEKARVFYNIETSIKRDLEIKIQYEKDLKEEEKKEEGKKEEGKKESSDESKSDDKTGTSGISDDKTGYSGISDDKSGASGKSDDKIEQSNKDQISDKKETTNDTKDENDTNDTKDENDTKDTKDLEETMIGTKTNKLYTEEDIVKQTSDLEKLKNKQEQNEEILKNLSDNIKRLKKQRHGEDSEQRQLYKIEYENKVRELTLIQKLVEQREIKLKLMSQLIDLHEDKNIKIKAGKLREDENEKQKNFLLLQNEMNNITETNMREMNEYSNKFQDDKISQIQNKLNDLEEGEIDIQHELVQNGGGRKGDKLSKLLTVSYKTDRNHRTKKKRNNIRKKDRSLRKRN